MLRLLSFKIFEKFRKGEGEVIKLTGRDEKDSCDE